MKKVISGILALTLCLAIVPSGTTAANSLTLYEYQIQIQELIDKCAASGIATDYEQAALAIVEKFSDELAQKPVMEEYVVDSCMRICEETIKDLNAYINGEKQAHSVSVLPNEKLNISGKSFVGSESKKPVFLNGVGHWEQVQKDLDFFEQIGLNYVQTQVNMSDVLREPNPADNWELLRQISDTTKVAQSNEQSKNGTYSLKLTDADGWVLNKLTYVHQKVEVEEKTTYNYKFYVKRRNAKNFWFSLKGKNLDTRRILNQTGEDSAWVEISGSYTTETGETELDLTFVNEHGAEAIYVDSVSLCKAGTNVNLVQNPSFENYTDKGYQLNESVINDIHTFLKDAEEHNVKVDLLIGVHNIPSFLLVLHPELEYSGYGFFDYDPLMPKSRELIKIYVQGLAEGIKDCSALNSICLTNEPSFISAFEPERYNTAYHNYLKKIYDSVDDLNDAYGTGYGDFDELDLSVFLVDKHNSKTAMYYDYKNFNEGLFAQWHSWLADTIKDVMPGIFVHSKALNYIGRADIHDLRSQTFNGASHETFQSFSDLNGCDASGGLYEEYSQTELDLWYDVLSSIKTVPVINSENHIISENSHDAAQYVYSATWQGAIHGMSASSVWIWDKQYDYAKQENHFDSLLTLKPEHLWKLSRVTMDMNRLSEELSAIQNTQAEVGILYSEAARAYSETHMNSVFEVYRTMNSLGERVRIITDTTAEELDDLKLIVVPDAECVPDLVFDALKNYNGELLIIGSNSLSKNEYAGQRIEKIQDADIIESTFDGVYISAPTEPELTQYISKYIQKSGRKINIVEAETGDAPSEVSWNTATYNGKTLISICNYGVKPVKLKISGFDSYKELISGDVMSEIIVANPNEPLLLEEKENIPVVQPTDVMIRKNGTDVRISWKNPSVVCDDIELIVNGSAVSGTWTMDEDAINAITLTDFSDDIELCKIVFSKDGEKSRYYFTLESETQNIPNDWTVEDANRLAQYKFLIDDIAHNGRHSLYFTANDSGWDPNRVFLYHKKGQQTDFETGYGYEVSFWYKCDTTANMQITLGDKTIENRDIWFMEPTNGWKKKTFYFTGNYEPSSFSNNNLIMRYINGKGGIWIDDIEAYKLDESNARISENLISNGSFENITENTTAICAASAISSDKAITIYSTCEAEIYIDGNYSGNTANKRFYADGLVNGKQYEFLVKNSSGNTDIVKAIPGVYTSKTEIINPILQARSNRYKISWINPDNNHISKISLYKAVADYETLISNEFSKLANDVCIYLMDAEHWDADYFRIVMEFDNAPKNEFLLGGVLANRASDGWETTVNNRTFPTMYQCNLSVSDKEMHSGNYALGFKANYDHEAYDGSYLYLRTPENGYTVENGKTYRIGMWLKSDDVSSVKLRLNNWIKSDDTTSSLDVQAIARYGDRNKFSVTRNDWHYYYWDRTATNDSGSNLMILFDEKAASLYIDDISIYELGDNGEPIGDNLISDGGFENITTSELEIHNFQTEKNGAKVNLSWNEPQSSLFTGVNVYVDGKLKAKLAKGVNAISLESISQGDFIEVRPVDSYGIESEGLSECFSYYPIKIYSNTGEISKIQQGQTYTITSDLTEGTVYLAFYEGDSLHSIVAGNVTEDITLTVPSADTITCLKAFVWSKSMMPFTNVCRWNF